MRLRRRFQNDKITSYEVSRSSAIHDCARAGNPGSARIITKRLTTHFISTRAQFSGVPAWKLRNKVLFAICPCFPSRNSLTKLRHGCGWPFSKTSSRGREIFPSGRTEVFCQRRRLRPLRPIAKRNSLLPRADNPGLQATAERWEPILSAFTRSRPAGFWIWPRQHGLKVFMDILWNKERCFLDSEKARRQPGKPFGRRPLRAAAHPAVFAYSLVNEIPADIVRWSGARAVADFIDELVGSRSKPIPVAYALSETFLPRNFCGRTRSILFRLTFICTSSARMRITARGCR